LLPTKKKSILIFKQRKNTAVANKLTIGIVFKYVKLQKRSIKTINSGSIRAVVVDGLILNSDLCFEFTSIQNKVKLLCN
jgi:uncharacterized radical SAM superfamily protein